MLADRLHRHSPPHHAVTVSALRAHLAAVDIGMAISALFAGIREYRFRVALRARDALVHPAQRIARRVVIELGIIADRLPATERVAVLAWDRQCTVRAARCGRGLLRRLAGATCRT